MRTVPVIADGVELRGPRLGADVIVDIATLTGAALICTGNAVSCTVSNRESLEKLSVECGRATGDLTFPLLWMPAFLKQEFASKVADMRNSVKDRMNAQSSAAAVFIHNHIEDLDRALAASRHRRPRLPPGGGGHWATASRPWPRSLITHSVTT